MAKFENGVLLLSPEEKKLLKEGKEYALINGGKESFLLVEKKFEPREETKKEDSEEKKQVIELIKKEKLSNLVEGKFEQLLNEKQRKALLELVAEQRVIVFKLNPSYKKGVYRLKERLEKKENKKIENNEAKKGIEEKKEKSFEEIVEETKKESLKEKEKIIPEKPISEYLIDVDGLQVIRNRVEAELFCNEREEEIREGKIKGLKSFDGNYYIIREELLNKYLWRAKKVFESKKNLTLEELAQSIKNAKILAKIVAEFLKEEGEIIEKKKENYSYVS